MAQDVGMQQLTATPRTHVQQMVWAFSHMRWHRLRQSQHACRCSVGYKSAALPFNDLHQHSCEETMLQICLLV